jgi:hypothetical protein
MNHQMMNIPISSWHTSVSVSPRFIATLREATRCSSGLLNKVDLRKVIFLDNQSTVNLFCNLSLVTDVKAIEGKPMQLLSNAGSMTVKKMATIPNFQDRVWYSSQAVTNILYLVIIKQQYRVTYDSWEDSFVVYCQDHGLDDIIFKLHPCHC